jgi:drug/metabolite transporter (DMT)-like permease
LPIAAWAQSTAKLGTWEYDPRPFTYRARVLHGDGTVHTVQVHGEPMADFGPNNPVVAGTALDITDRESIEVQLQHAQKMTAPRHLAADPVKVWPTMPMIPPATRSAPVQAFVYYALGVLGFAVVDVATRLLRVDHDLGTWQITFLTRIPPLLVALAVTAQATGSPFRVQTRHFRMHMLRGALVLLTTTTFFAALKYLPLADCIVIAFAAPIFVTALSGPMLKEQVGWRRWSAVAVGFAGVIVAVDPTGSWEGETGLGIGLVLLSAVAYALTLLTLRQLSGREHTHNLLFYSTAFTLVVAAVPGIAEWKPIGWETAGVMLIQGIASAFGQLAMIRAFRFGEASMLAPIEFTALIWATLFGFWFWGDLPTVFVLIGAALIIGANLYIAHREARQAQRKRFPPVPEHASLPE